MARYYKPAQGRIRDGGIFQPDWELAQKAFLQKDSDMGDVIDTLSILDTPVIDYNRQADQGYADEVEAAMQGQIDDVARGIMEDVGNASKNKRALATLKKDFEKSAESGDLYKLSSHRQAIDDWQKKVGGLKNISEQQKYGNYLNKYYQDAGGMGAKDNPFNSIGVVSQDGTSFSDFIGSDFYKALVADETGREWTNTNGVKMMKINNKLVELTPQRIAEAYQGWLNDNPDALLRAQIGEEHLGEEGQWLDENGQLGAFTMEDVLDDEGKVIGRQIAPTNTIQGRSLAQGLLSVPHKKDYRSEVFQRYELQYEKNLEHNNFRRQQKYLNPESFGPQVDSDGMMNDRAKKIAEEDYINRFKHQLKNSIISSLPVPTTPEEGEEVFETQNQYRDYIDNKLNSLEDIANYAKNLGLENIQGEALLASELTSNYYTWNKLNTVLVADGKKPLTGPEQKKLIADTDVQFKNQINNGKMNISLSQEYVMDFENEKGEIVETFDLGKELGLEPGEVFDTYRYRGKVITDPRTKEKVTIKEISYKDGSVLPNFRNSPATNGRSLSDNLATVDLRFEVIPVKRGNSFYDDAQPLIFNGTVDMGQKNGGVSFPNVFD